MKINKIVIYSVLFVFYCFTILGLSLAQIALSWTIDDLNTLFPLGVFIRDYIWHLEAIIAFSLLIIWKFALDFDVCVLIWCIINILIWLVALTLCIIDIGTGSAVIQVNGQ